MKRKASQIQNKEEICEDWCFECKDGGTLYTCDYGDCLKAYHAKCTGKEESFFESGGNLICKWHCCFKCQKRSRFQCYCCPKSICKQCISDAEFVCVRGSKGLCGYCLKVALLAEDNKDTDSEGEKVNFKDKDTIEGLFWEYWLLVKEEEKLTVNDLRYADAQLRKRESQTSGSFPSESGKSLDESLVSNFEEDNSASEFDITHLQKEKRSKTQKTSVNVPGKSKEIEFVGWGSKALIEFLTSIGKDVGKELSEDEVEAVINSYINENKLFLPEKKKKIMCDQRLHALFGKKTFMRYNMKGLLEYHFLANKEFLEEDLLGFSSEQREMEDTSSLQCKREKKSVTCKKAQESEGVVAPRSCFASIVAENIKLVYLQKCLVMELLKDPETFESKIKGSFVKVKSDPNDYMQKNRYQLVLVTGVRNKSSEEKKDEVVLKVSNMFDEIPVNMLSDANFSEEECEDLRERVKSGRLRKLTIVEIEEKAKSLRQLVMKHWIAKELVSLQHQIDRANEKGWRKEFFELLEKRELLQTESEQTRLLQEDAKVIAEEPEIKSIPDDAIKELKHEVDISPESILTRNSETLVKFGGENVCSSGDKAVGSGHSHSGNTGSISATYGVGITKPGEAHRNMQDTEEVESICRDHFDAAQRDTEEMESICRDRSDAAQRDTEEVESICRGRSDAAQRDTEEVESICRDHSDVGQRDELQHGSQMKIQINGAKQKMVKTEEILTIDSSSDEDSGDSLRVACPKKNSEDPIWLCLGPNRERKGPYSVSLLKNWGKLSPFALKFKVWRAGESEENAIPLWNVVQQFYPGE